MRPRSNGLERSAVSAVVFAAVVAGFVGLGSVAVRAGAAEEPLYRVEAGDRAMERAVRMARDTFASFLGKFAAPQPGTHDYAVKVDLSGGIGPSELVWLKPFALRGHDVVGAIANTPEIRTEFKQGQLIAVNRDDVVDWMYRESETRKGNFTGCALLAQEAAAERDATVRRLHLSCPPFP